MCSHFTSCGWNDTLLGLDDSQCCLWWPYTTATHASHACRESRSHRLVRTFLLLFSSFFCVCVLPARHRCFGLLRGLHCCFDCILLIICRFHFVLLASACWKQRIWNKSCRYTSSLHMLWVAEIAAFSSHHTTVHETLESHVHFSFCY